MKEKILPIITLIVLVIAICVLIFIPENSAVQAKTGTNSPSCCCGESTYNSSSCCCGGTSGTSSCCGR